MYNKLFTKILDSSIWLESTPTRIVWLTLIAAMDEQGYAQFAAVKNVAHRARVTVEEADEALRVLEAPDLDSSNPDNEGRRIERVPGGWIVLNAEKHRQLVTSLVNKEQNRIRVQRHRDRKRNGVAISEPLQEHYGNASEAEAEAEAHSETEAETKIPKSNNKLARSVVAASNKRNGGVNSNGPRPIFIGNCFVVHEWMLEVIRRMLGAHTDDFGLDVWFDSFDRETAARHLVMSRDEQWNFLQAGLFEEAKRRGLPIAAVESSKKKPSLSQRMTALVQGAQS